MNGRESWTRERLDGIEADNIQAARIVSEIISSGKLKPLHVPARDDDYDVVLSGLVKNVRLLVDEFRALLTNPHPDHEGQLTMNEERMRYFIEVGTPGEWERIDFR